MKYITTRIIPIELHRIFACVVLLLFMSGCLPTTTATKPSVVQQIKQQEQAQLLSVLNQVIPHDLHDNELFSSCTLVQAEELGTEQAMPAYIAKINGEPSAIAIEAIAPDGYNGAIKVIVGMKIDGTILGTRVLSHQETPGLGDKIDLRVTDWITSFKGKQVTRQGRYINSKGGYKLLKQ